MKEENQDINYICGKIALKVILVILLLITVVTTANIINKKKYRQCGIDLVYAMYEVDNVNNLLNTHNNILLNVATEEVTAHISLENNPNRLDYTYYGMTQSQIVPIIKRATDNCIEFTLSVDGIEHDDLRAIWFTVDRKTYRVNGIAEATLLDFPVNGGDGN